MLELNTFSLNTQDYGLIFLSFAIWVLLFFIGLDKVYKMYFWLFLGFLIAMVLWLQSEVVASKFWNMDLNSFEKIILTKKYLIHNYWSLFVILFMFWMLFNNSIFFTNNKNSLLNSILSFILWFFILIFLFGTLFILEKYWIVMNSLLAYIAWFLADSNIFALIKRYDYLIYYLLFFIIFYRIILYIFFILIIGLAKRIKELRDQEQARIIIAWEPEKEKKPEKKVTKIDIKKISD
jgi:hypothetical protein